MGIKSPFLSEIVNDTHDQWPYDHTIENCLFASGQRYVVGDKEDEGQQSDESGEDTHIGRHSIN